MLSKYYGSLLLTFLVFVTAATIRAQDKAPTATPAETRGASQLATVQLCNNAMTAEERADLAVKINEREAHYQAGNKHWSRLYHLTLFGSIVLSALAALVVKLSFSEGNWAYRHQNDMAAVLATASAVLMSINAGGQYNKRWLVDRVAMADIAQVQTAFTDPCVSGADIRKMLDEVRRRQATGLGG